MINDKTYFQLLSKLYICDPYKNTKCKKTACHIFGGECDCTLDKCFAKIDSDGNPLAYVDTLTDKEQQDDF